MPFDRAVFLKRNDYAYGLGFNRIEQLQIPDFTFIDINDAIEYYEIKRYFDDGCRGKDWTDEQYAEYNEKSQRLFGLAMRFFNALSDSTVVDTYAKIEEVLYYKPFWMLFNSCKLYNKISQTAFDRLLHSEHINLFDILAYKQISIHYGKVLRDFILETPNHISLILQVYEQDYIKDDKKLFLPPEFSEQDIIHIVDTYIDSDNPNPNYLQQIFQMRTKSPFCIPDVIRLKAIRKYNEKKEVVLKDGISYEYEQRIVLSADQEELKVAKADGRKFVISYSSTWLLNTLDYPGVLENFIYLFEFVDIFQVRCLLVAKESQSGILERAMKSKSERYYPLNFDFQFNNSLSDMQMEVYYSFLNNNGVRLEDAMEWFFTQYLQNDFGCSEMRIQFPSEGSSYLDKCSSICAAFESAIKQFSLFVEQGEIDFELLELLSGSKRIDDIPSMVNNKYIYGTGKEFNDIKFILFSDQCMFSFIRRIYDEERSYNCFFDLLSKEDVFLSDYRDDKQKTLRWLADQDILDIKENGLLKLGNPWKVAIIKDLFQNDVISFYHYPSEFYPVFQEWIDLGYLETKSTLFTRSEAKYFNYILNDTDFDNGLKLRNKYSHGNQQGIADETVHKQNYLIFLKLFIILIIKINDDFSLKECQDQMNGDMLNGDM